MRDVLEQAQHLGEAILKSDIYQRMQKAESSASQDSEAAKVIAAYMEKQKAVEELLGSPQVDPSALAEAGEALEDAERAMNNLAVIQEMQAARKEFTDMMNGINQILNVIVTGRLGDENSGCTGSCSTCGGCCGH